MEDLRPLPYEIVPAQPQDAQVIFYIEREAWLQTYPSEEHGIDRADVEKRFSDSTNRMAEIVKDIATQDDTNTF